jgi:hypothetical protein
MTEQEKASMLADMLLLLREIGRYPIPPEVLITPETLRRDSEGSDDPPAINCGTP